LQCWRVLAETGDNRTRLTDAHGLKAYVGAAPVTRASGKKFVVLHLSQEKPASRRRLPLDLCCHRSSPVLERIRTDAGWPVTDTLPLNATCSTRSLRNLY
jgi:hypothetical protein